MRGERRGEFLSDFLSAMACLMRFYTTNIRLPRDFTVHFKVTLKEQDNIIIIIIIITEIFRVA